MKSAGLRFQSRVSIVLTSGADFASGSSAATAAGELDLNSDTMAQNLSEAPNGLAGAEPDDGYFNTERLKAGLSTRTARGGAITFASQGFKFCASLGTT